MKPYIYQDPTDGMWVVESALGERRFLHRRWAFANAHTAAVQSRRFHPFGFNDGSTTLDGAPYEWHLPEREAEVWGTWSTDAAESQPPFEGRFTTGRFPTGIGWSLPRNEVAA